MAQVEKFSEHLSPLMLLINLAIKPRTVCVELYNQSC